MTGDVDRLPRGAPAIAGMGWGALALILLLLMTSAIAETPTPETVATPNGRVTLAVRNADLAEVMEMLSRQERVNILLADGVDGEVSVNLYDVPLDRAIKSIATAAGYGLERRDDTYFIVERDEVGKHAAGGPTQLRTFKVQYSKPEAVKDILKNYLSGYGEITALPERGLLIVEDMPHFLNRIARLLRQIDREPKQILIEAKILEIGLRDGESYGLDWAKLFKSNGGSGSFGVRALANPGSPGLFFDLVTPNVEVFLDTLRERDRLRTLSSPKILALEDQEAETIIGDRLGYNVTTTINQVTTTSVEYLESGVILRVRPSVDEQGRVLLDIHPEVSSGTVSDDGIPNQTTTEVTTTMLVESGETVFIGGLIKRSTQETREGVPVLGDLPVLRALFSNRAINSVNSELVVLITPYLIDRQRVRLDAGLSGRIDTEQADLERNAERVYRHFQGMTFIGEGRHEHAETEAAPASESD